MMKLTQCMLPNETSLHLVAYLDDTKTVIFQLEWKEGNTAASAVIPTDKAQILVALAAVRK